MATSSSSSISGISTGVDTTALINAIVAQKGGNLTRLKAQRELNDKRSAALTAMSTSLTTLGYSLLALQDRINGRTVTSSDANNTNVTATGSGAASGNYDVTVTTVATKGQIAPVQGSVLSVKDPTAAIFSSSSASFAVQGTDGVIKTFELTTNSLNGLKDAINSSGAGVSASVVNTGSGTNPYLLVITAKGTGTGSTGAGVVTLAAIDNDGPPKHPAVTPTELINNADVSLGLGLSGTIAGTFAAPTGITGGLVSAVPKDAVFTVNGITLTRKTNVVSDAVEGMTFTLKQGGQTGMTTLTVAPDKTGATTAMQDFLTKYNQLVKDYKTASTSTKNADGSVNQAPLAGDASARALMLNLRAALASTSTGMPTDSAYKTLGSMGITTQADGSLTMNTISFQGAMVTDLASVQLNFSQGLGQSARALITTFTGMGAGGVSTLLNSIITQNKNLDVQVQSAQSRLDTETKNLKAKFARMESIVGQMRASSAALTGA